MNLHYAVLLFFVFYFIVNQGRRYKGLEYLIMAAGILNFGFASTSSPDFQLVKSLSFILMLTTSTIYVTSSNIYIMIKNKYQKNRLKNSLVFFILSFVFLVEINSRKNLIINDLPSYMAIFGVMVFVLTILESVFGKKDQIFLATKTLNMLSLIPLFLYMARYSQFYIFLIMISSFSAIAFTGFSLLKEDYI